MRPLVLTEWVMSSGTLKKYASDHVRRPGFSYLGYLSSVSGLRMEIPHPAGLPSAGTATLRYDNTGREFSVLRSAEYIEGTEVKVLYGYEGDPYASFATLFTGVVDGESGAGELEFQVTLRDRFQLAWDNEATGRITSAVFPRYRRGQPWTFRPIVFGRVRKVPCPYVDTENYRFVVAQHACSRVRNVYVYGVIVSPSTYEIIESTIGGQVHTLIGFFADPVDPNRTDPTIVTADVDGATDDELSTGNLLTNPVAVLEAYYLRHVPELAANLNTASFTATAAKVRQPFSGALVRQAPHSQFVGRLLQTFGIDQFCDSAGLLTVSKLDKASIWATTRTLDDSTIGLDSWFRARREEIANRVSYGLDFYWAGDQGGYFQDFETFNNGPQQAFMGIVVEPTQTINAWFADGRTDAHNLVAGLMQWYGPRRDRVIVDVPLPLYVSQGYPLGAAVLVTHFEGADPDGTYSDELFKTVAVELDLQSLTARLGLIRLNQRLTRNFRLTSRAQALTWTTASASEKDTYGFLTARATGKYSDGASGKVLYLR